MESGENVFLAPTDAENFDQTVRTPVDLAAYPDAPAELGEGSVRFWGVRDGTQNETFFEKMQPRDLVLFYDDSTYIGTGWIGTTVSDEGEWASETVWGGAPSHLLYTVEEFTEADTPMSAVNRIFGYADSYHPQGLLRVADNRVDNNLEAIKAAVERFARRQRV